MLQRSYYSRESVLIGGRKNGRREKIYKSQTFPPKAGRTEYIEQRLYYIVAS